MATDPSADKIDFLDFQAGCGADPDCHNSATHHATATCCGEHVDLYCGQCRTQTLLTKDAWHCPRCGKLWDPAWQSVPVGPPQATREPDMTHPCFLGAPQLIDHLANLPDPTPLEVCVLHTLIDQADIIDRAGAIMERFGRMDKRYRAEVRDDRTRAEAEHREYRAQAEATIAALRRQIRDLRGAVHA